MSKEEAFTNDDLKQVQDQCADKAQFDMQDFARFRFYRYKLKALLARMEAADKIAWLVKRFVERNGDAPDCRCDFCFALQVWRKSKGDA